MKWMRIWAAGAAAFGAGLAQAQVVYDQVVYEEVAVPGERVIIEEPRVLDGSPFHRGGATLEDRALADEVGYAMASNPRIAAGLTATIVANDGEVTIGGTAQDYEQAQRAEIAARRAAGGTRVAGFISSTSG